MSSRTHARKDASSEAIQAPRLRTLLLTDLCDSTALVERIGDNAAAALFREHDRLVVKLQQHWRGRLIDRSDGLLLLFDRPIDGLGFALDYARGLKTMGDAHALALRARQGLHVGEVLTWRNSDEAISIGAKPLEVEGLAKPTAARLMSMARPGQILLSAVAESLTHRAARELGNRADRLLWKSHGRWRFKGMPTAMEIYEVGEVGLTPLRMPKNSAKAWRDVPLWRRPAALVAEVGVVLGIGFAIWLFARPQPALAFAERDWVVVGTVRNLTSDVMLDGALDQALRISLEQSRYVNVLSEDRTLKLLALMRKDPAKDPLDRKNASDVALRTGARAVLLPSVGYVGGRTRFVVEVVDPKTQQTVAVSTAFGSNPSILSAVDTVTGELRTQLGENRDSIRQNSPALPDVTTSSLDALRAYALGQQRYSEGKYGAALDFFQKAVDIDPHFALAWLGQVRAHFANVDYKKATETLRVAEQFKSRLPPREALYVKSWGVQILDPAQAADSWIQMAELYPDYAPAQANAAMDLFVANRFADALPYARASAQGKYDLSSVSLDMYGRILLALGQYDQADQAVRKAVGSGWNGALLRQAAVAAAKRDYSGARDALARVDKTNFHADITRTTIALDEGDLHAAVAHAQVGLSAGLNRRGTDRINYYVPLATALLASGQRPKAAEVAEEGARLALRDLGADVPIDRIDNLSTALAAALIMARAGDTQGAAKVRQQVKVAPLTYANRLVVELGAVVDAEILLAEQRPDDAFRMLSPYLDSMSRFQTRATAMRAARLGQRNADARIQHDWIRQHRGLAYAEIECGYCLQPLNLVDLRTAEDSWIAEAQG
ncbi:putative peptide modification system cyclase [Xanthomonas phaseoli]|uniref:Adenylate cyclase n=1 Tax=Xanthomonas phaseoli pv. dieffenbachiae TaxID=92828 RepID=A0A1V9H4T0_9XANT|nr:putative peptide modification system cyclase [Xanthomonas phaseoli]MBO9787937.1 putative peptide modification system cyclase [Xanthomonas phaseoli pv. dieffenbachiae]MBO9832217.1 putative peptide modification system cyclase [Xanthomonas phaseoli pv. dieffenbachiae]MBO9836344.1 putative peptide modification system cyclase [Xanthomonas phaseoli pv. dieffenbachiae]MBO9841645.1 putative peptide modification system cyclase [Xanthomonas phaseoli pv. dieffenbachiae]MBO9852256.1 putative peptide mo